MKGMYKIRIANPAGKMIGALRVSDEVFTKITALAEKKAVSRQEVIRAILDAVIDDIEI
jgi:predicted DNA-binding protein